MLANAGIDGYTSTTGHFTDQCSAYIRPWFSATSGLVSPSVTMKTSHHKSSRYDTNIDAPRHSIYPERQRQPLTASPASLPMHSDTSTRIHDVGMNYSMAQRDLEQNSSRNSRCHDAYNGRSEVIDPYSVNVAGSFNMTVIQRHHSKQRPSLNCFQRELYFLARTDPSIRTVEASANAKVFLETYFSSLRSMSKTRHERRMELECWLQGAKITLSAREKHRKEWFKKESGHLRKSRKLKMRSRHMTLYKKDAAPGGFGILKVLGKGSFGTVCLVQDKSEDLIRSTNESVLSIESRAISDQCFQPSNKKMKIHHHPNRNSRSADQLRGPKQAEPRPVYAMKIIRKTDMIQNAQEGHIRAERDFLVASVKSRWVVDLIASFQDKANLYLAMEYMIGGDFLSLLIKYDTLNEKHTRWYIAEMIMCIEAVHSLKWIHRDVKPDNFLISHSGHLKIADFGLAFDGHWSHDQSYYHSQRYSILQKLNIPVTGDMYDIETIRASMTEPDFDKEVYLTRREKEATLRHDPETGDTYGCNSILQWRDQIGRRAFAKSLVGTSQYMAPEIINGQEYDGRCDWWSIGIILYEVSRSLSLGD